MNQPVMGGVAAVNAPAYVKQQKLINWVGEIAALTKPDTHLLVRRLARRIRPPVRRDGRRRHHEEAEPGQAPEQLPGLLRPVRRRARRRPHLHLLRQQGRRRPDQQLDGAGRDARHAARPVRRLHARPHHVRGAVLDGPARFADRAHRRRTVRLAVCRRQHAHHDAHGHAPCTTCWAATANSCRACTPSARRCSRARRTWRGRATRPSTSCITRKPAKSGPSAPATAATRCWARSASRCASPPPWAATRAGWPSTC